MAEEATTQVSTDTSAENTAADSQSGEQTTQGDAGDTQSQDQSNEQSQTSNTEGKADDASTGDKSKSTDQDSKQDSKPLSRRSAAYRIQQLTRENKQLREQQKPKQDQDDWDDEGASDDQPNPEITALKAEVEELKGLVKPVMTSTAKAADDAELSEVFSGDKAADKDKYEGKIRELWELPQYKDVAAADLYKIAKFDELQASIPAIQQKAIEDYKQAEKEAKESSASGNSNTSNRTGKGGKSVWDMTPEEFQKQNEQVKAQL